MLDIRYWKISFLDLMNEYLADKWIRCSQIEMEKQLI